LVGWLVGWL
jgi:translation initiation factor 6